MVKAWVVGWDSWEKQNREGGGGGEELQFCEGISYTILSIVHTEFWALSWMETQLSRA